VEAKHAAAQSGLAGGTMNETEDLSFRQDELPEDRSLIIVDDDRAFAQRLVRAMELRGFGAFPQRTFLRSIGYRPRDYIITLGLLMFVVAYFVVKIY
jgi:hypothetical protein